MLRFDFEETPETKKWRKEFPSEFKKALLEGVKKSMFFVEGKAKESFGKAGKLKVQTGHLRRSIKSSVKERHNMLVASLFSNVIYAAIHESGGVIRATNKPYLKFQIGNRWVSVKEVTIPARPYLEPAISENVDEMYKIIYDNIKERMR